MKQLPPDTVRLLSSAQVITSVLNVVKELMENSLDAGASSIDIKLENYGLDRIEVRDNGRGIKAEDTPVMAVRHFTSKICSHEDLERLETYGFRGEALGSICAVAEVSIITKTEEDDISTQYTLNLTGGIVSQKPSHLGQGTTVSVLKLFKNLPVRRQYYSSAKKCKEELKKVQDLLTAYAIIKPELRLSLVHNKVAVWQKSRAADLRSALVAALGSGAVANLLPCHHHQEQPEILLEGFFPKPGADLSSTSSSHPDRTFIFVNSRPVHHRDVMKLLRQHYAAQYPEDSARSRYPTAVLQLSVPPSSVDVNLTPDKTQVLLQDKEAVLTAVEAFLVSLYGYRPDGGDPGAEKQTSPEPQLSSKPPDNVPRDADDVETEVCLHVQASTNSSSSSVAEDWIINPIPAGLESNFSLGVEETQEPAAQSRSEEQDASSASDTSRELIPAEAWSRGTALSDPASGEPLQPVSIHTPSASTHTPSAPSASTHTPSASTHTPSAPSASTHTPSEREEEARRPSNAITEKRAALTAFDLISSRAMRAPPSPAALFEKEARAAVLRERPAASLQDISAAVHQRWKNLGEEERKKYEEQARRRLENHDHRSRLAAEGGAGPKRKAPLSNQKLLDELFSAQPQKRARSGPAAAAMTAPPRPCRPLPCSVAALRRRLQRLSSGGGGALPRGLRLVKQLASHSAWLVLCGQRLSLLNPFRVEEALLFKRLVENHILSAASLQEPIALTDGNLGGAEYMDVLCSMEKQRPELNGKVFFSDPRLVANGFQVQLTPGLTSAERHLEVTAMADYVPFLGLEDLREILTAVLHRKARELQHCRPLKVTNYLQGEAVRLARQLPSALSREHVEETLRRMQQQLQESSWSCIHGRPFLHTLCDLPQTQDEAQARVRPLDL